MSWEAWFTLGLVVLTVVALVREVTAPAAIVFGGAVVLLVAGVLEPEEAFSGFSNPAPLTVAALYVVAAGVEKTGILNRIVGGGLGGPEVGERSVLSRLLWPTAGASAFLNNTPIVAMMVPPVSRWAEREGRSPSRFLMPVSYAAMLGGMVTLIGTSTNIVVSGLLEEFGMEPLKFFEIGKLGLPVAVVGVGLLVVGAPWLLAERRSASSDVDDVREFVVEMRVDRAGPLDGLSVAEADLRHLAGVFLVQVERGDDVVAPVAPDMILRGGDLLRFVGNARDVTDLHGKTGLTAEADPHASRIPAGRMAFFEAVIGDSSPLVGASLRSIGFRARYQAAVVAIHRAGQRVEGKLGEVRLRNGDTLLLMASPAFRGRWHGTPDFLLVSRFGGPDPVRSHKTLPAIVIGLSVVIVASLGVLSILEASLLGAFAMVAVGALSPVEARAAVDIDVIVVIASSFGLGAAVAKTGLAAEVAGAIVDGLDGVGGVAVLIGIALLVTLLTETITNNAAAVLMFPVAIATAVEVGADPRAYAMVVAVVASAAFLTPIGYQTNTMVWGPGGYRFGDYTRLGLPLTVMTITVVALVAPLWFSL